MTKYVFVFILPISTLTSFFCTFSQTSKRNYFISKMYTQFMCKKIYIYIHDCHKSGKKSFFSKTHNFLWKQFDAIFFVFFTYTTQNKSGTTKWPVVEARSTRSQTCVMYRGIIIFIKRNTIVNTSNLKIFHKKMSKKVVFPDVIFNFSKIVCVLDWISCMTGELWPTRFIWH